MKVQMLRAVVAGRQPRKDGEILDLPDKEAKALILEGAALECVTSVAPEKAVLEASAMAVMPSARGRKVKRG